jgi:uncharacterized membrane protein
MTEQAVIGLFAVASLVLSVVVVVMCVLTIRDFNRAQRDLDAARRDRSSRPG